MIDDKNSICNQIIADINYALRMFGEYHYYDKGASEVMDCRKWKHILSKMPANDVADILIDVLKNEHGQPFVCDVVVRFDDSDEQYWDILMSHEQLAKFY